MTNEEIKALLRELSETADAAGVSKKVRITFDPKRRELLHQVRRGEVDLDSLPLPIYESKEEHEERMKALELPGSHAEG